MYFIDLFKILCEVFCVPQDCLCSYLGLWNNVSALKRPFLAVFPKIISYSLVWQSLMLTLWACNDYGEDWINYTFKSLAIWNLFPPAFLVLNPWCSSSVTIEKSHFPFLAAVRFKGLLWGHQSRSRIYPTKVATLRFLFHWFNLC